MDTIKSSERINELFKYGKRIHTKAITFIILPIKSDRETVLSGRVAFIAGKKLGNAVWRNRAKRRLRELFKCSKCSYEKFDVVLLAKENILNKPFWKIVEEIDVALKPLCK